MEQSRTDRVPRRQVGCQVVHGGWASEMRGLPRGLGEGSLGDRQGSHVLWEEGDVGVSQKIINSSQAKENFKDHFLPQISNERVF